METVVPAVPKLHTNDEPEEIDDGNHIIILYYIFAQKKYQGGSTSTNYANTGGNFMQRASHIQTTRYTRRKKSTGVCCHSMWLQSSQ